MDCSMTGFPVLHHLLEFAQTHVHWIDDAIQPSHPLSSPPPSALNLFQHQGLFQWVGSLYQVAKVLQLKHQSFQWILISFRIDWFDLPAVQGTLKSSPTPQLKSVNSSMVSFLYGPTFTSIHGYWKKNIALTIGTFAGKIMSLLFNVLSKLVIAFLPRRVVRVMLSFKAQRDQGGGNREADETLCKLITVVPHPPPPPHHPHHSECHDGARTGPGGFVW